MIVSTENIDFIRRKLSLYEEDTCSHNHHDLLLEILLIARNILIINTDLDYKMTKETN